MTIPESKPHEGHDFVSAKTFENEIKEYAKRIGSLSRAIESLKKVEKAADEPSKNYLAIVAKHVDDLKDHLIKTEEQLTDNKHPLTLKDQQSTKQLMSYYLPALWNGVNGLCTRMEKQTQKNVDHPEKTFIQRCEEYKSRLDTIKKSVEPLNQENIDDWYLTHCLENLNTKIKELEKEFVHAAEKYYEGSITQEEQEVTNAWAKFSLHNLPRQVLSLTKRIEQAQKKSSPPSPETPAKD